MFFNSESGCVQLWVNAIKNNKMTFAQVPNLLNLREIVDNLINK